MSAIIEIKDGNTWQIRVSGIITKSDLDKVQAAAREDIRNFGKIKVLLILDGMQGWEPGADWSDMSFIVTHGDDVEKIAMVGDLKWQTEALMFVGAGIRRTQVKYFPLAEMEQARAWLHG